MGSDDALDLPAGRLDLARLGEVSTGRLLEELQAALEITAEHLVYVAHLWAELEARGVNLAPLRNGIKVFLSDIATGRLLPGLVLRFLDRPGVLRQLAGSPLDEQRRLVAGGELVLPRASSRVAPKAAPADAALAMLAAGRAEDARAAPSFVETARHAGAGDLADLLIQMLLANPAAADVARAILPRVEALARR